MKKNILIPITVTISVIIATFLLFDDLEVFFTGLLQQAKETPDTYALLSFLVLASDVFLPVPSSIIMFTNGYVLGTGYGTVLSLLSVTAGAVVGYYLGKFTALGLRSGSDEKANGIISSYGALAILITRSIPVLSETISITCGFNRMPFKKYVAYNVLGYLPLCLIYAVCGRVGYDRNIFLISFGSSIVIAVVLWLFTRRFLLSAKQVIR
ncbi:MAG TPA: VTT domain-containing protein [Chitinophagaceae bacterium]|nr:VTT domain-containing protein [Chitinophagaceae bacterium]